MQITKIVSQSILTSTKAVPLVWRRTIVSPLYFPLKKKLCQHRFEEGYDLHDDEYILWLQVNHPEALPEESSITEFFPDTPMLTLLDSGTSDNIVSLTSRGCLPSNDSSGSTLSSSSFDNSGQAPETLSGDNSLQNKRIVYPWRKFS